MPLYLVTVDMPMPSCHGLAPLALRMSVYIEAPHADAAKWRALDWAPVEIVDCQPMKEGESHVG